MNRRDGATWAKGAPELTGWGAGCGMQGWPPPHVLSACHLSTHGDKRPLGTDSGSPCSAQHLAEQGGVRGSRLRSFQRIKPNPQTQTRSRSAQSASPRLAGSVAHPQCCECCGLLGLGLGAAAAVKEQPDPRARGFGQGRIFAGAPRVERILV